MNGKTAGAAAAAERGQHNEGQHSSKKHTKPKLKASVKVSYRKTRKLEIVK